MHRKLLLLLFCALGGISIMAQTEVSGGIFSPMTWEAANSPYLVTGEVVVFPGASLTIEAGTEVRFQAGVGLELRSGSITVNGTETAPVILTIDPNEPTGSSWKGIFCTATFPDSSFSMDFDHFTIEHADTGIKYNGGGYRSINSGTFRFNGIGAEHGDAGYDFLTFTDCNFSNNDVGTKGRASFFNCNFNDNVHATEDLYSFSNGSEGARVVDCSFSNNEACFINDDIIINRAIIRNSVFENNGTVATAFLIDADSSLFIGSEGHAIYAYRTNVRNCTFTANGIGLRTTETSEGDTVRNNFFRNNSVGIQLDGPGTAFVDNVICDNDTGAVVSTPLNVNLANNCWCTADPLEIEDQIFDAFDDVSSGIAQYIPFNTDCAGPLFFAGDSDNNGRADAWDLLPIGIHYGEVGPARENATTNWAGQLVSDWDQEMITGLDLKHVDADGSGMIDIDDAEVIMDNYDLTHSNTSNFSPVFADEGTYELRLVMPEEVFANQLVSLPLEIAAPSDPLSDFYGIAFAMTADVSFFNEGSFSIDFNGSWLGTPSELMYVYQEIPELDRIEIAIVRRDGQPVSGYGLIANLNFVMSEDLILSIGSSQGFSPIANPFIDLIEIEAITHEGLIINTNYKPQELVISSTTSTDPELDISIFPNPVSDQLYLSGDLSTINSFRIYDQRGAVLVNGAANQTSIDVSELASGLYTIEFFMDKTSVSRRLLVQ
ncbi:MAG: T9SS type A sorting domain-containing protein [Bacteroidota bacterium]